MRVTDNGVADFTVLDGPAWEVAPRLLGSTLVREIDGQRLAGRIVETEAYDQTDEASHSYRGETPRTRVMFGPSGFLYVYFTYGMHYCCNIVVGGSGYGSAVLIRALEPVAGVAAMARSRHQEPHSIALTNGPAKLCQALQIGKAQNGADLRSGDVRLIIGPASAQSDIVQTTRIGISRAQDQPWRFYLRNNPYVSRPVL